MGKPGGRGGVLIWFYLVFFLKEKKRIENEEELKIPLSLTQALVYAKRTQGTAGGLKKGDAGFRVWGDDASVFPSIVVRFFPPGGGVEGGVLLDLMIPLREGSFFGFWGGGAKRMKDIGPNAGKENHPTQAERKSRGKPEEIESLAS